VSHAPALSDRAFGVLQGEPEFLDQLVNGRTRPLPGAVGLEAQVADAATPRSDDAADGPEVCAIGVLLVQVLDDIRRNPDKGAKGRG
jgi:hypothetical protein